MSEPSVIIDAGPLVAMIRKEDEYHEWAVRTVDALQPPFLTSESVISETAFLLHRHGGGIAELAAMFQREALRVVLDFGNEWPHLARLMAKYSTLPSKKHMSLADATLVRLAELHDSASVMTLDRDFRIYRKHARRQIPLIAPWGGAP
ncbi:MAG TPA: PIN domain-containing protein [Phycisphaerae bacterium]|nr:PIN domain-containing protein [Phycisphaerae bacterium]